MEKTLFNRTLVAAAAIVLLGVSAIAQKPSHVMANVADTKWGPAPPLLPPGAQIAVLSGDPGKPAPYAVRLKFPANYAIPAHSHPTDENVVVVSGSLFMGLGDKLNKTGAMAVSVGGYALAPAGVNHFAFTKAETTIVLFGIGPVEFKYVNPSDDPRGARN
jgi:quercetin dioxygenase-like cupin family protein